MLTTLACVAVIGPSDCSQCQLQSAAAVRRETSLLHTFSYATVSSTSRLSVEAVLQYIGCRLIEAYAKRC